MRVMGSCDMNALLHVIFPIRTPKQIVPELACPASTIRLQRECTCHVWMTREEAGTLGRRGRLTQNGKVFRCNRGWRPTQAIASQWEYKCCRRQKRDIKCVRVIVERRLSSNRCTCCATSIDVMGTRYHGVAPFHHANGSIEYLPISSGWPHF